MKQLDDYFRIQKEIYDYFGYVERWRVFPLDDHREYYWYLTDDVVRFSETEKTLLDWDSGEYYENEIYRQRHLSKWVYRGDEYTLIVMDTHTDGNILLGVFDNSKEILSANIDL